MVMMYGHTSSIPQVEQVANLPLSIVSPSTLPQFPPLAQLPQPAQLPQLGPPEVIVVRDVEQRPIYNELAVGTNLAKAPRNWLTDDRRLVPVSQSRSIEGTIALPPSVEISNFSDEDVDFIAPAENIKKIFKMPYSNAELSLVVHKIGRTIVLDKLSKEEAGYFACESQPSSRLTEIEEVISPPDSPEKAYKAKKKNKLKAFEDALYSKFLYYTLLAKEQKDSTGNPNSETKEQKESTDDLPKPAKTFSRLFRWRFRDNIVLFGTDMVIFTHEKQPAISIRLRDMDKKMSVLTPLDYWLDNVMTGIPVVAICNHQNGYVQGYQLLKTEELPRLHPTLTFHPGLVEEHASQVFKFLQTNCTQETGTYWLYKGVGDPTLKLYNVSNVQKPQSQAEPAKKERPFALPVGMMCYTLATKILQQNKPDSRTRAKDLLEKCLEMLDETKFPSVWAYAQEKMADTACTFTLPTLFGTQVPSQNSTDKKPPDPPVPMTTRVLQGALNACSQYTDSQLADAETQFVTSVHHLSKGLSALAQLEDAPAHKLQVLSMKSKAAYCYYMLAKIYNERRKFGAALHWLQLSSQSIKSLQATTPQQKLFFGALCGLCADIYVGISQFMTAETLQENQNDLAFTGTSKSETPNIQTTTSARTSSPPLISTASAIPISSSPSSSSTSVVLSSSPTFKSPPFFPSSSPPPKASSFTNAPQTTQPSTLSSSTPSQTSPSTPTPPDLVTVSEQLALDQEENLRTASSYYLKGLGFITSEEDASEFVNLTKRLGNAQNLLGIHYMNTSRFTKAAWHFQLAVDTFKQIKDDPNIALIYCNIGKLMRVYAHNERMNTLPPSTPSSSTSTPTPPSTPAATPLPQSSSIVANGDDPMSEKELSHYTKAVGFYNSAKDALKDRKTHPMIWDAVHSQLASTYVVMGLRTAATQGSTLLAHDDAKLACEHLLRALKMYDALRDDHQAAVVHLHLATLYAKMIRTADTESERRSKIKIAMLHFDKAFAKFTPEKYPKEYLCAKFEFAIMQEQMPATTNTTKIDHLTKSLLSLLDIGQVLINLPSYLSPSSTSSSPPSAELTNFVQQNETLKNSDSGNVKAKVEDILKQLLKLTAPPSSSSSTSASPSLSSSTSSTSSSTSATFKQLFKDVLSAQSVAQLGNVLNTAKPIVEKFL